MQGTSVHDNELLNSDAQQRKGGGIYLGTGTIYLGGENDTVTIANNSATTGDGMYRAAGTSVGANPNVTYTNDQEYVEPPP